MRGNFRFCAIASLWVIEIWFAEEARIGQKNKITRRSAKSGSRPSAPRDQRTASIYIFDAISPKDGKGAALILPKCNTYAMNLHLAEIARNIAPDTHAVVLLDQAGPVARLGSKIDEATVRRFRNIVT